jgi:hypothetical protein
MATILQKPVCLSYRDVAEEYRNSGESYCYKISRALGQSPCFPCRKNEENPFSKGCHISSVEDLGDSMTTIKEDNFIIGDETLRVLTKVDRWTLGKKGNFIELQKEMNNLNRDEWCSYTCKHPMRIAFLSPSQLKTYELLRGNKIVDDIKAFSGIDADYFKELLNKKSEYPKLAIALEIAEKV